MAESTSSNRKNSSTTDSNAKKWACNYCTYLNWEASAKCVLCYQPRNRPMLIEELCPPICDDATHSGYAAPFPDEQHQQLTSAATAENVRWPCSTCTYMNCRRTKRCIQCRADRPHAFVTPPNSGSSPKGRQAGGGGHSPQQNPVANPPPQNLTESQQLISRALNKWACTTCTFDNWPTASKCTICGQVRAIIVREQSRSPPQQQQPQQRKRSETPLQQQQRVRRQDSGGGGAGGDLERLEQLSIGGGRLPDYTSALDIYVRRFLANDPVEKLFFRAAGAIGHRDMQMVNQVVDYLINEGNLQRALTAFEARLMNQYIARGGTCRVVGFDRADSLFFLAQKSECLDLVKLIRRVRPDEDRLPCALNCATRTRLYAKVTAQCMAVRDGPSTMGGGHFFKCQFIAHPHSFSLFNMPMPGSDLSLAVQNALFRPAPSIPPQLCYLDCYDAMASQGGLVVGRPPNFLMRNRGGPHSLYDSIFQAMFGVCDRFNVLRAATKYTMHRSSHLFKVRWLEQQLRMVRDCGLSVSAAELDTDWEELLNSVGEEDECPEAIHVWALAHVCCRPIIVCPMDDPVDVDQLLPLGGGGGRSPSPRNQSGPGADGGVRQEPETTGSDTHRVTGQHDEKPPLRQINHHSYEGIYLPMLWAPSAPISRSPLLICYRNGLFHAVVVTDSLYQRDAEVQRYVRIRRALRRPGMAGDSLFRFLTRAELDNGSGLLAQFILFGHSTAQQLSIRREPHLVLTETLHFYKNWIQAMLQLSSEGNVTCGTATGAQLESRMDSILMGGGGKKRKGGGGGGGSPAGAMAQLHQAPFNHHQQALMAQLFSPQQQMLSQQTGRQQQQFLTHSGRSSPEEEEEEFGNEDETSREADDTEAGRQGD